MFLSVGRSPWTYSLRTYSRTYSLGHFPSRTFFLAKTGSKLACWHSMVTSQKLFNAIYMQGRSSDKVKVSIFYILFGRTFVGR